MGMRNTLVCYNNGLVGVHDNFQRIGENLCFNTIHRNSVNFIAAIRSKNNCFMRSGRQPCFACRNRSMPAVHLCCQVIGRLDLLRFRHIIDSWKDQFGRLQSSVDYALVEQDFVSYE